MRTGAIFARGSCRALKWVVLLGVVFALGVGQSAGAERTVNLTDATLTNGTLTVAVDDVDEGGQENVAVTVSAEIPANTATATTVTVVVSGAATAVASLDPGVTPAEPGDWIFVNPSSNATGTSSSREFVFPANTTNSSVRMDFATGTGSIDPILLQARNTDTDAENEGVTLSLATTGGLTDPTAGPATLDVLIDDAQTQSYVFTPSSTTAAEGATGTTAIKVKLSANPPHYEGSTTLTLQHNMPALVTSLSVAVDPATTTVSDGTPVSGNSVTIGSGTATGTPPGSPGSSTTSAEITIETVANDGNRVDDTLTVSAYSGVGLDPAATATIVLEDAHMLPTLTATLTDANGMAVTNNMVTEGMDYTLELTVASPATEDLTVMLATSGTADPLDDYSLPMTPIMIATGATSSAPVTLEVDLNDDLDDESLMISATVNGNDAMYGQPQPGLNPMSVLSLTIDDMTSKLVWAKDPAVIDAAVATAKAEASGGDNPGDDFSLAGTALFDTEAGYSASYVASSSDPTKVSVSSDGATIMVMPEAPGSAMITVTATAAMSSATISPQTQPNIASIMFEVVVVAAPLLPPGPPRNLTATPLDEAVRLSYEHPNTGGAHSGYEYRVDAGEWKSKTRTTVGFTVGDLTNGVAYVFELRAVNDAGKSDAVSVKATPMATPVDASQVVTVKSVSAATSVAESGGLEVTVTATIPAGTKGADDKIAAIASKQLMVTFPTDDPSIMAGEDADAGELTPLGATNGMYTWTNIARKEEASEATYKFRVAVGQDLDAEDEKFQVHVRIDGDGKESKVVTIDDAQEQKYTLSLPSAAKGAITEGKSAKLTLKADPKRTIDIPVTLALEPNDPSRYTLSAANGTFGTTSFETTVSTKSDSDRADDMLTVTAYTDLHGEFASLDITIKDANALPAVKATLVDDDGDALDPQPESVMEGETVKVMLTAVDKDGKAMKAAEKLTITLMPTGSADAADYRLSNQSFEIAKDKESSAAVDLMITEDQDIGEETLMFDAAVAGEAKNGTEKRSVAGVISLMIMDGTQKLVWANSQEDVEAAVYAAKNAGAGDDMTFTAGEMIEVMGSALFSSAEGVTLSYTASSSMSDVASASVSGGTVMVTAMAEGMADITITAHASMASGAVTRVEQTDPGQASVMFMVEVGLEALSITLMGPDGEDMMNVVEGGMGAMVTATANRAVTADTMVMLMRDRAMSSANDADYTAEAITIPAGEMMGSTMVMAVEDNMAEDMEELVLYGMTEGMAGEVTGEVKLYLWDAAVPALPVIAQLLLAAFLAAGGYRRYRRR